MILNVFEIAWNSNEFQGLTRTTPSSENKPGGRQIVTPGDTVNSNNHQFDDVQTSKQQINQQLLDQLLIDHGKLMKIDQLLIEYWKQDKRSVIGNRFPPSLVAPLKQGPADLF